MGISAQAENKFVLFVLFRLSKDWMVLSLHQFKCSSILETPLQTPPEIMFNQPSAYPLAQVRWYIKLTITPFKDTTARWLSTSCKENCVTRNQIGWNFGLGLSTFRTARNKFLFLKPPNHQYFVMRARANSFMSSFLSGLATTPDPRSDLYLPSWGKYKSGQGLAQQSHFHTLHYPFFHGYHTFSLCLYKTQEIVQLDSCLSLSFLPRKAACQ